MQPIHESIPVAATTADSRYITVPCRGNIAKVYAVYDQETDEDEVFTLYRDSDAVCTITPPADATAEGTKINGVMDAINGGLIFDPDSATAANQVIKVGIPDTVDTAGNLDLYIEYDDSAYVEQAASEA
jgi:hypothetical protein